MPLKDLDPAQFARVTTLLDAARALGPEERTAWHAELSMREPEYAGLIGELLATHSAADGDALPETQHAPEAQFATATDIQDSPVGKVFGPYRILRALGRGGMGSVWLAERADGLFTRLVALKLLHAHLVGTALTERFARERAILGALNHPHIARLLDAGFSEGQPFLALEYVEGVPLTTYCDARRLSLQSRVELMLQVLSAVQHAHRNLVIHRDLKPSNILVTQDGRVSLLDFGIAKLMSEGEARETELTQAGGRALTPDYASPEQIAGLPITTASDVYSLGVVLYELLCGSRPYRLKRDSRGALEDAILSVEAVRLSQAAMPDEIAQARAMTVKKLRQALAGDLDTIAGKALKKDPAERYATADAFQQDLRRYLAGRPVLARPDSAGYRLRKFVARNRVAVSIATATAVALLAATSISLWQARVAREHAVIAQREAKRAQAVQDFLVDIFRTNSETQNDPIKARQTTARELLDIGARRIAARFKDAPEVQAEVADSLADMYQEVGLDEESADMLAQEIRALKQVYGGQDRRVAQTLLSLAGTLFPTTRRAEGLAALAEARDILDATHDDSRTRGVLLIESARSQMYGSLPQMHRDAEAAVRFFKERYPDDDILITAQRLAGRARYWLGDYRGAEAYYNEALGNLAGGSSPQDLATYITLMVELADTETALLKLDDAESALRRALEESRKRNGELHVDTLHVETRLGAFLHATSRRDEGRALLADALRKVGEGKGTATPNVIAPVRRNYAAGLFADGRIAEAAELIGADIANLRRRYAQALPLANGLRDQGAALTARGHYSEAERTLAEAAAIWAATSGGAAHPSTFNSFALEKARLQLARGNPAAAIEQLRDVAPPQEVAGLPLRLDEVAAQLLRAQALLQLGRGAEAETVAGQALDEIVGSPLRSYYQTLEADAALRLGQAQQRNGRSAAARSHLERAVQLRAANEDRRLSPWLAEAQIALADCSLDVGDRSTARAFLDQAKAIHAEQAELGEHFEAPLRALRARLAAR
jgi:serine/threonine-protein kinase